MDEFEAPPSAVVEFSGITSPSEQLPLTSIIPLQTAAVSLRVVGSSTITAVPLDRVQLKCRGSLLVGSSICGS